MKHITESIKKRFPNFTLCKDNVLELMMYLFCCFPFTIWVTTYFPGAIAMGTDTQPYAMVFSILLFLFFIWKGNLLSGEQIILFALTLVMGSLGIMSLTGVGVKVVAADYATYISLALIPYATCLILRRTNGLNENLIKIIIWIWFFVGVIQLTINDTLGNILVVRQSTNADRGVVGLAPEPSAYGYVCFFLLLFVLEFKKHSKLYALLLLIQIYFFAESTVTLIYVGVYIVGLLINNIIQRKRFAIIQMVALFGGGLAALYLAYGFHILPTRLQQMAEYLFTANWKLLFWDRSMQMRFYAIQNSIISFIGNYGMPHGFLTSREMSGTGILLIEGGFIGIAYLILIGRIIWHAYPKQKRFIFVFGFMIIMLSAIPFSSPIVCFYIGYCLYKGCNGENQQHIKEQKIESSVGM